MERVVCGILAHVQTTPPFLLVRHARLLSWECFLEEKHDWTEADLDATPGKKLRRQSREPSGGRG